MVFLTLPHSMLAIWLPPVILLALAEGANWSTCTKQSSIWLRRTQIYYPEFWLVRFRQSRVKIDTIGVRSCAEHVRYTKLYLTLHSSWKNNPTHRHCVVALWSFRFAYIWLQMLLGTFQKCKVVDTWHLVRELSKSCIWYDVNVGAGLLYWVYSR